MNRIRVCNFGDPGVLKLEDVVIPTPGTGQILVKIHSVGVNPVETYIRSGMYGPHPLPYTPGTDAAGTVEASEDASWKPGERVFTTGSLTGTYADYAICTASQLFRLPEEISFDQGAATWIPAATAARSLLLGEARPGETILIHGATGSVGLSATQLAAAAGLKVLGTGGTPEGRDLALREGACFMEDHSSPGYRERLMDFTGGKGVDLILEMLGNRNLGDDLPMLAFRGRVVVIGNRGPKNCGRVEINPRDLMARDARVMGMSLRNVTALEAATLGEALASALGSGTLRPVIGPILPLSEAAEAHRLVLERRLPGKIVLHP